MAIKKIKDATDKICFDVYVARRSNIDPSIRVQKRKTGFPTIEEAQRAEKKLIESVVREIVELEKLGIRWGRLVEEWERTLPTRAEAKNGNHVSLAGEDYLQSIYTWTEQWWQLPAEEIRPIDIKDVFQKMSQLGRSKATQEKLRSAINRVFNFGIENRFFTRISQSPAIGLRSSTERAEKKKPEILSYTQIVTLLQQARDFGSPWYSIWAVAVMTGLRSGELLALRWKDVDFEQKIIRVHRSYNRKLRMETPTKGRDWRDIPMNSELEKLLKQLRASDGTRDHVLLKNREWERGGQARHLRQFCRNTNLPSIRFHTLRACFATQLLRQGVPPLVVMKIGGWKSLKTMEIYVRKAGIEVQGATDKLSFMPPEGTFGEVVDLFGGTKG